MRNSKFEILRYAQNDNPYASDNPSVTASRATSPYTGEAGGGDSSLTLRMTFILSP
ncbi:MAG: hypothetical protein U0L88_10825 [Acutalibacteraceae bacterium]|nr:hypothetical protein [Acutalibacteraceae bacterium]